jgi:ferredoxin, 2Fe-2S
MPKVIYQSHNGTHSEVEVPIGTTVMQGAVKNRIDGIIAECGGNCMCATCHVYVDQKFLPLLEPVGDTEDAMLDSTACERKPNSRLSCQLKMTATLDGLLVVLPESQY